MTITVEQLRQALETAPQFPTATYVEQLQERARTVSDLSFLQSGLGNGLAQEKFLHGDHLSGGNAGALIDRLAQSSTAHALSNISPGDDNYGFRDCIDKSVSKLTFTDSLTRLMGCCFADHIEAHLVGKGLPKLSELEQDANFVSQYQAMFLNPDTIDQQIEHDVQVSNIAYSSSLLFVSNYFQHQATPTVHEPSAIWVKTFGQIAEAKIKAAVAIAQTDKSKILIRLLAQSLPIGYGQLASSNQDYLRPPTTGEILEPLGGMNVPEDVKKEIEALKQHGLQLGDWKSYGELLVNLWETVASQYDGAVRTQAMNQTAHYEPPPMFSEPGVVPPTIITTTTGQNVKDWISRARSTYPEMIVRDPPKNWDMKVQSPFGSCFVAGTQILTRSGAKNIEDLAEHDWVLTRGEFDEWGLVSDEKVVVPVEMPIIHGFNDEKPFFTAGHVFFTTTGLRALNPTLAMQENPWADVGRLAVGHIVLRLNTVTKKYEQIAIRSMSTETMMSVKHVYGIHLREGRRSYHANGYLVAVNYPEITMKSIAKMLRTVPVGEQARMLLAFKELRPLFERLGVGGVSDLLQSEVETESEKNSMRLYKTSRNKLTGPSNGSRQYPLEEIPGYDYSDLKAPLPTVSVLDGVVCIDGEACNRAAISNMRNEIRWTREIPGEERVFEHGLLHVDPLIHSAQGNIVYSHDAKAENLLSAEPVHFLAMGEPMDHPPSYEETMAAPAAFAMAATEEVESFEMEKEEEPEPEGQAEAFDEPDTPRIVKGEAMSMRMATTAAVDEADTDPNFLPPNETMPFMRPLRFDLIYDANRWKKDQVKPSDPVSFGPLDLAVGRKTAAGLATRVALLPDLDKLLDTITTKVHDTSLGQLRNFYSSTLSIEDDGRTKVTIRMTPNSQELLKQYKDKSESDDFSTKCVFKESLASDVSLGMLFSTIEVILGADEKTAMGYITEYSLDSDTGEGTKHLLVSNPESTARRVDIEKRLDGANKAGDIKTGSPTTPISTPQNPPPARPGPKGPFHVSTIDGILYKNEDLEMKSKKILEDIMYFHMEQKDLNDIFNKKQPDSLPDHLAGNLPSNLQKWIKDTYSPAFTALTIAESYNTKDWQSKFTEKERAKILYFWQGDGPKCLSSAPEYKQLNQISVREAMLRLYGVLQQFVTDNGPKWATDYYKEVKDNFLESTIEQAVTNNQQPLQKYCNILYVLDPDAQYAKEFYDEVVETVASQMLIQKMDLSDTATPWLPAACDWLVEALLNPNDTSIKKEVRDAFMKDFEAFCKDQNKEFERENKTKAAAALMSQFKLAASMPTALGAMSIMAKGLWYRSTTQITQNSWLKNNDISKTGGKLATVIKVFALLASIANLIFTKDVKLSDSEKAKVGGTIAKNVMDILGPHFTKATPRTAAQIDAEVAVLNDKVRKTPFGWRRGKLVEEKVKYMEKLGEESLQIEKNVEKSKGLLSRIKGKISLPAKVVRIIGIVIAVAFIGFLIWDLVAHGGTMSAGQMALGIINIILEVAIVVCEVLSLIFPAVTIIPVIGQILAIAVLIVGVLVMIFSTTEHQKTPGEKFVDRMKGGWLTTIDGPPDPLLDASISSDSGNKGSNWSYTITLKNNKSNTIKFIEAAPQIPGTPPSTDRINATSLSFFSGSDDTTLFSNGAFTGPGETTQNGSGTWSVNIAGEKPTDTWDVALLKPNGTNLKSTNYELRIKAKPSQSPEIASGKAITLTVSGTLGSTAGTPMVKVIERRPGAPFCPTTFGITRE
ncbi:hypothetical protein EJ04DRAFT_555937 [Polyplosphaeria fusca]|uniref:Uncharacterized protein n=1 Tax=Polyplosphaeria fusca TaxID=682080 RepID=A0A9P4UY81_9PLEO|nr:hypothetical protein EJ04DRAFT_555937 [Polyplosphaeria fusca]